MKLSTLVLACLALISVVSMYGCGEKTVGISGSTKLEQSQTCIDCHQSAVSPGTANNIVAEWKLSHHNTSNAAGCADCHEPEAGHPASCNLCHGLNIPVGTPSAPKHVSKNPDADLKCYKCHGATNGLFPTGSRAAHFGKTAYPLAFGGYTASYVSTNYIGNCRKCHNPHDPTSNYSYNSAWAKSGHGEVATPARRSRDFKLFGTSQSARLAYANSSPSNTTVAADIAKGTPVCVRCHTTTGFINFVESTFFGEKFTDARPFGSDADKTKEVTACDACHTGYDFRLRAIPRVTIFYNYSGKTIASAGNPAGHAKIQNNPVVFPDLKSSNVCIPCHAGRGGSGPVITSYSNMGVDFSELTEVRNHDFTGAALLTSKSGYEFAGKEYTSGTGANTGHDTAGLSSGKGPCITCHMNKSVKSDSHTFKPVIHDTAQFALYTSNRTWAQVYSVSSASPASLKIASVTSQSCNTLGCHISLNDTELNIDKEGFISALAVLNKWIRLVRYVPANPLLPYNSSSNKARSTTNWTYLGTGTGADMMGANFNHATLINEPGAYVHNPLYAKRLIFDSIFYLSTTATNPALNTDMLSNTYQYPAVQQFNVADAIYYLTTTTARTLETVGATSNVEVRALVTQQQAETAIKWLYGKTWADLNSAPAGKLKRPGDN